MAQNKQYTDQTNFWNKDVKAMSNDDLIEAVRFLDQERQMLTRQVYTLTEEQPNKFSKEEKISRVA